jgi:hypothetical protein
MAGDSMLEKLSAALSTAVADALAGTNPALPALTPPDPAAVQAALAQLGPAAARITDAGDLTQWDTAAQGWTTALQQLADSAFGGPDSGAAMLVRVLEERAPRTAAFLSLAGVIRRNPSGPDGIDWPRAQQVLTDPGTAVNESLWDALLGDAGLPGTGRLPAVIIALLILAPQTIYALVEGDLKVNGLPAPATQAPGDWRIFRERSEGWISITVPLGDPEQPTPTPSSIFDLAADLEPDLSATLALRSQRRPTGTGTVTDFEMWLALASTINRWQYTFGAGWYLRIEPGITVGFGYDGSWHAAFREFPLGTVAPPAPSDPVVISFGRDLPDGAPDLVLGPPYDTRIVIQDLELYIKVRDQHPIVEIGASVKGFALTLTNRWFRTFGITNDTLGDGLRFDLDLDIAYVEGTGLTLNANAGLEVQFDIDKQFGKDNSVVNFKLHSIHLLAPIDATLEGIDVRAEVRFHLSLKAGPVTLVVDGIGGYLGVRYDGGLSMLPVGFLPPTGAGLQIHAGSVTGGGFLDFTGGPTDRFAGVLYLKIGAFEVTAFGIHELTGAPGDANRHTSIVLVLGIAFSPGIQLGYGIEISGFGGLIGINRRADTDALRERLTSGAAGNVLFAEDPIRNAPDILDDLDALFPPAPGISVFGPTIQLSWLNIFGVKFLRVDIGVFLEIPSSKVIILGSARASIPPTKDGPKLIDIHLDVVGLIDVPNALVEFDATLISSKVLYDFHLTGDAAFRLHWGDQPYLFLTLGGFHPDFHPEPAVFPDLTRLALTLKDPQLPGLIFRAEAYLAVTTNTVQFGGRVELGYVKKSFNLVGFLQLDALIQFRPFTFSVEFSAGVQLRYNELTLVGIKFSGTITGPGPFVITGKACIEVLWFDICADASITIGSSQGPAPAGVSSATNALHPELLDPANLRSVGGDDSLAAQQPRPTAGTRTRVSPLGALQWTQRRAPLATLIDRFEGQPLPAQQRVVLSSPQTNGLAADWFAPGSFANLSQADQLNRPSFEQLPAGANLTFPAVASDAVRHEIVVQEIHLPLPTPKPGLAFGFSHALLAAMQERTAPATVRTRTPKVSVHGETFVVRDGDGNVAVAATSAADAHQFAKVFGGLAVPATDLVDIGAL